MPITLKSDTKIVVVTSLEWWTWLVPPLASFLWTVPTVVIIVVEVSAVFTGFGAVIPRMSIITTDFAREVRTHGVDGSVYLLLAPFLHLLDEEVQFCGNHIRLLDSMHTLYTGLVLFIAPPLIGDYLLDQYFGASDGQVEEGSFSSSINVGSGCRREPIVEAL